MTRQQAIDAKCKDCIYDPEDVGTWRQQVERCELADCSLWQYRPKSRSKMPDITHSAPVQPHYEPISVQVGQGVMVYDQETF